ncbi:7735_t:CDS:2, partial [Gigaspora rosea]
KLWSLIFRPPVVSIMGHIDHSNLLFWILFATVKCKKKKKSQLENEEEESEQAS